MDLDKAIIYKSMFPNGVPKDTLINILVQMADALHYCHTQKFMVHRDLHVGNWMITEDYTIKLIDFGLANIMGENGVSKDFWVTKHFQSPETKKGIPSGFEGDIFYLAFTFYSLVHPNMYFPFANFVLSPTNRINIVYGGITDAIKQSWCGKSPRPFPQGYSEYDHLITRMMDKNQHTRATITEVVKILA